MISFKIYSLSNFQICNTVFLTIVTMLSITYLWLIYFINGILCLLTLFSHLSHPLPLATTSLFSVCMSLVFFCFVFFKDHSFVFFLKLFFIYLFILGCVGSSLLCEGFLQLWQAGPLFIAVRGPLTVVASFVAEHRLQTRRLSSCGSRA